MQTFVFSVFRRKISFVENVFLLRYLYFPYVRNVCLLGYLKMLTVSNGTMGSPYFPIQLKVFPALRQKTAIHAKAVENVEIFE